MFRKVKREGVLTYWVWVHYLTNIKESPSLSRSPYKMRFFLNRGTVVDGEMVMWVP